MRRFRISFKGLREIASDQLIYIVSDILIKAVSFISMPFFLNVMSTTDFGQFSLYLTYLNIITLVFGLNVSNAIIRYYVDKVNEKKYLVTAVWIVILSGCLFSALILSGKYVFGVVNIQSKVLVVLLISAAFNCLTNIGLEVIRSENNVMLYGISSVINSILSTAGGLLLIYNMENELAFWRLISICISSLFIGGALTVRLVYKDGIKGNLGTAKYLLSYSIPLIPYTLSSIILVQVDRFFLANISLSDVGIYSFASNLAMIIYIISMALNRSLQPKLYAALRDNKGFRLNRNIGLFYLFYIAFIFGSDLLVLIFSNKEYQKALPVIPLLMLGYGYCFLYSIYSNFIYYYKKTSLISMFAVISAMAIIVMNYILIPRYSYFGAAYSAMISYALLFILGYWYVQKKLKIRVFEFKTICILQLSLIIPVIIKILGVL